MLTPETSKAALKIKGFLKSTGMVAVAQSLRHNGFRDTLKRFGWKIFAVVFVCYLVRDVVIYILVPWWIARIAMP